MMSNKRRNNRNIDLTDQTEISTNNVVDKDVQSMFLPFTVLQTILLSPKYRIKNNIITANNLFNKVLSLCGTVICSSLYLIRFFQIIKLKIYVLTNIQIISLYTNVWFNFCGFFFNFVSDLIQTESYALFILSIQEVHRFGNCEVVSKFMRNSWISVTMIIICYILLCVYSYILYPSMPLTASIGRVALICFDLNVVYAIRFIKLLEIKVLQWSHQVLHSFNDDQNGVCHNILFHSYLQILESYQIYKNLFHQVVSYT